MRTWIFSLTSTTLISSGIFAVIFLNSDPASRPTVVIFGFFFTLLIAITSIVSLLCTLISLKFTKHKHKLGLQTILRRSLILALIIVGLLLFSALNVLNFLSAFNFILALLLMEIFFASRKKESLNEN